MVDRSRRSSEAVDVSVVLPCRDVAKTLADQLDALTTQVWSGSWEILVVDNQSRDDTAAIARLYPAVRVVSADQRSGASYARNVGLSSSLGHSVIFCDGDDIVRPGWLAAMGEALSSHSFVAGALAVERLNPDWLVRTRGLPSASEIATFHGIYPTAPGGNFGVNREIARAIGGFDERLVAAEDAEFSLRMWLAGHRLVLVPAAVVDYRYSRGVRRLWRQGLTYGSSRPLVARKLRDLGIKHVPSLPGWKSWLWLVRNIPISTSEERLSAWAWVASNRIGHVLGSIRNRVVFL